MDQTPPTPARGASPSKAIRTPEEAMEMARKTPGRKIVVSEGHEKYGARVKANDIRAGKRGPWRKYQGEVCTSALKQDDGSYNIYVYVQAETAPTTD